MQNAIERPKIYTQWGLEVYILGTNEIDKNGHKVKCVHVRETLSSVLRDCGYSDVQGDYPKTMVHENATQWENEHYPIDQLRTNNFNVIIRDIALINPQLATEWFTISHSVIDELRYIHPEDNSL